MQYSDDQISKDTGVERILVFDGKGNVTVYDTRGIVLNGGTSYEAVRFGDLDGLSDDEIIDLAKKKTASGLTPQSSQPSTKRMKT